jgi:hypothetical protein
MNDDFFCLALMPANNAMAIIELKPLNPNIGAQINFINVVAAIKITANAIVRRFNFIIIIILAKISVIALVANGFF